MRVLLFATAAFAALVTARSSRHRTRDGLESAEPIRINSTHGDIELFPKPLPDGIGWYPKGQGPDTGTEQKDARVQAGGIDEPLNGFKIKLTMGNKKHHVGQHKGAGLYRAMHVALMELCPEGRGECFVKEEKEFIVKVDYQDKKSIKQGDAIIRVTGSSYDGPGSRDNRNLRRQLLIAAIAAAWEQQSNDGKNCFPVIGGSHCNIGSPITVNIENQDFITAEIFAPPHGGRFDCVATIQAARGSLDKDATEWRRAYHGADLNGIEVVCPNKDVT